MKSDCIEFALKLSGMIRSASEDAIQAVLPEIEPESLPAVKLRILTRKYLLPDTADDIPLLADVGSEEAEHILKDAQADLMEELVPAMLPAEDQLELAMFMLQCLEEQGRFQSLFEDALQSSSFEGNLPETAGRLQAEAKARFSSEAAPPQEEKRRPGTYFPEGYPYMDEFEYIDYCIAGEDD